MSWQYPLLLHLIILKHCLKLMSSQCCLFCLLCLSLSQKSLLFSKLFSHSSQNSSLTLLSHRYKEEAAELGIDFRRSESLNGSPLLMDAQADLVATHLKTNELVSFCEKKQKKI